MRAVRKTCMCTVGKTKSTQRAEQADGVRDWLSKQLNLQNKRFVDGSRLRVKRGS